MYIKFLWFILEKKIREYVYWSFITIFERKIK